MAAFFRRLFGFFVNRRILTTSATVINKNPVTEFMAVKVSQNVNSVEKYQHSDMNNLVVTCFQK